MPAIKIEQIGGQLPAWDDHLLPAGQAAEAVNLYAFRGRMEGWRQPKFLRTLNNSAAKFAFRVPTAVAQAAAALLMFTGNPSNNDTATVGEYTYTFVTVVHNPNDVLIGASALTTAQNFLAAITADFGAQTQEGIKYGQGTSPNPDCGITGSGTICYQGWAPLGTGSGSAAYIPFIAAVAPVVGAAMNTVAVSDTSANLVWTSDQVSLTHTTTTYAGGLNASSNTGITQSANWLEFTDVDTNVVRSQVINDTFQRYYFASPSQRPQYNTAARIAAGQPAFLLGINPPTLSPTVATVAGSGGDTFQLPTANLSQNGSNTVSLTANTVYLIPFVPTGAMTLGAVMFMPKSNDANVQFAGVVFADASNNVGPGTQTVPGALLGTGTITTGITSGTQASSTFGAPVALTANTPYWFGLIINTNENLGKSSAATSTSFTFAATFTNGPPGFAPASGTANQADPMIWGIFNSSAVQEARSYVYTYVTQFFEESAPSPFTIANGWSNATWQINMSQPPPADMGSRRNIAFFRIYRTVTGTSGNTSFNWVADVPINTTVFYDNAPDSQIALNFILASTNYFPPPGSLQGLLALPNGMIAGFAGNQVFICQPFQPHAWPPGNVFTTEFPIVGLGFTNGALVACTQANPYILSGTTPALMSITKCQPVEPCQSRGSILSTDIAVYFISPNGLIQVTNLGQCTNITELWVTRDKWNLLAPTGAAQSRAVALASCFFCYGVGQPSGGATSYNSPFGFAIELNQDNQSFTIWPQPGGHRVGFTQLSGPNNTNVDNIFLDPWTGIALVLQGGVINYFDFTDTNPTMMPYVYRSKVYQQNTKKNFSAMRAFYTPQQSAPPPDTVSPNTKPTNDASWNILQPSQPAIIQVFADYDQTGNMVLVTARELANSGKLMRIANGFKAENWQFRVIGQVPISNLQVATSIKELGNV